VRAAAAEHAAECVENSRRADSTVLAGKSA
jgi:hypothetical protein